MNCGYCKDKINLALNGFSGIKEKFCQTCWSKIYSVYKGNRIAKEEPEILNWVVKIKNE
jgi:hypothetical protein